MRLPGLSAIPLPVYREFVDMLYSMRLPIFGLGVVFVSICLLAAFEFNEPVYAVLAALGILTTFLRLASLDAYVRAPIVDDLNGLLRWERRYAIGNYASAVLLALLNAMALMVHDPLLHLITISLVFGFGAGVVSRISVRPKICVISLLLATVPTITTLMVNALSKHSNTLHAEMYLIEAMLVVLITGLSLQTVAYLYRSAVKYHTVTHDLAHLAKYDVLTGLANRLLLRERFQLSIAATRKGGQLLALHFLDLDGFKAVNDRYGHQIGDALLEQVACRLEAMVRAGDTVARLGGDEFVVVQGGLRHEDEAQMLARRIVRQLSLPYQINDSVVSVSVSVGIAIAPDQGVGLEPLLACADTALYRAKAGGKARAIFCTFDDAASVNMAV
jgi:diguanylate cyclase